MVHLYVHFARYQLCTYFGKVLLEHSRVRDAYSQTVFGAGGMLEGGVGEHAGVNYERGICRGLPFSEMKKFVCSL